MVLWWVTHRGYKTYKSMEYSLTVCGTLALEGGPIFWVAIHRQHHQNEDKNKEGDPHSPREGGFWARRLAPDRPNHAQRCGKSFALAFPTFAMTGTYHHTGCDPSRRWRMEVRTVGHFLSYGPRPPLNLVSELCDPYVGIAAVSHRRYFQKQLLGRFVDFGEGWHNNHHAHPQLPAMAWPGTKSILSGTSLPAYGCSDLCGT